mmetsp:Transcript_2817/g.8260  ORF Transcript_2817/g.8260 Transcript_2817/m.8260 type:complete len:539 (+) Transcript_2817:2396-4012(+)
MDAGAQADDGAGVGRIRLQQITFPIKDDRARVSGQPHEAFRHPRQRHSRHVARSEREAHRVKRVHRGCKDLVPEAKVGAGLGGEIVEQLVLPAEVAGGRVGLLALVAACDICGAAGTSPAVGAGGDDNDSDKLQPGVRKRRKAHDQRLRRVAPAHRHEFHARPALYRRVMKRLDSLGRVGLDGSEGHRAQVVKQLQAEPRMIAALEAEDVGEAGRADRHRELARSTVCGCRRQALAANCEAEIVTRGGQEREHFVQVEFVHQLLGGPMERHQLARDRWRCHVVRGTGVCEPGRAAILKAHLAEDGAGVEICGVVDDGTGSAEVDAHASHLHSPSSRSDVDELTVDLKVQRPRVCARPSPRGDDALVHARLVDDIVPQVWEGADQQLAALEVALDRLLGRAVGTGGQLRAGCVEGEGGREELGDGAIGRLVVERELDPPAHQLLGRFGEGHVYKRDSNGRMRLMGGHERHAVLGQLGGLLEGKDQVERRLAARTKHADWRVVESHARLEGAAAGRAHAAQRVGEGRDETLPRLRGNARR